MKKIIIVLLVAFLLVGCSSKYEGRKVRIFTPSYTKNDEINSIIEGGDYTIVDVRTKEEYEESHVKEAINIPYDEIDEKTKLDKSKKIMVYCKSGTRSGKAYNTLISLGYDAYDMGAFSDLQLEKE